MRPEENVGCRNGENGNLRLSRVSLLVGFMAALSFFGAFVGNGWVYTKEPYRLANLNLYTSITFKIGLWKGCHSFKRINSTIHLPLPSCTPISYTNWTEITHQTLGVHYESESAVSVMSRIRWCTLFVGCGFLFNAVGLLYSIFGHYYQDSKTVVASALYTLSGLCSAAGLFSFVCHVTDAFGSSASMSAFESRDPRMAYDYKYGWCFYAVGLASIFSESAAVICITVHNRRCQTIDEMIRDIFPEYGKMMHENYYTMKESASGCSPKPEDETLDDSKPEPEPNGVLSETPPDLCSSFLNAEEAGDTELPLPTAVKPTCPNKEHYATLNTRNYRCLNYASSSNHRRYSTMSGCSLLHTNPDVPSSSSSSSSATVFRCPTTETRCTRSANQITLPRTKNCTAGKYCTASNKIECTEMQQLSDNFGS